MTHTRRTFLATTAAFATVPSVLPFMAHAAGHGANTFETADGPIVVHPIRHASIVMETPAGLVFVDPVGEAALYNSFDTPDLILVTHEHGDHFSAEVLNAVAGDNTKIVVNPNVGGMLSGSMAQNATILANGESSEVIGIGIEAIPAYNITEERMNFHPKGRDNGYVLTVSGTRVYISGDTEDIPEMRALTNIDLAFVCMNLPFTMDSTAAADAVSEFKPTYVYAYHYRGRDGGTQDPEAFASLLADGIEAKSHGWYG